MADDFLTSDDVVSDEQSFYNVVRLTGNGMTPFWDSLNDAEAFDGNPATGHIWYQTPDATAGETNAHNEGSIRADVEGATEVELRNHLQIFKRSYGVTGSQAASKSKVVASLLERSKDRSIKQLRLDVEKALMSATAPVQRVGNTTAGVMGGVLHYCTEVIDATNTVELSAKAHIKAPLRTMWENGVLEDKIILCGGDVKDSISTLLDGFKTANNNETAYVGNVSKIKDVGWATNVEVKVSTQLAANEMLIYAPELINPILLRQKKDASVTDPAYDSEAWENLFELTLQVLDPYAAVHVKNIKIV